MTQSDHTPAPNQSIAGITPAPTEEEAAAIAAAIMVTLTGSGSSSEPEPVSSRWRFGGRWWNHRSPVRRRRPSLR